MNITDSKVKFMFNGNLYTLLEKDEDGDIKIHGSNIVTKQEVLDNSPSITYKDTVKIYYHLNGKNIQLAVKEDIEYSNLHTVLFNNKNVDIDYDNSICAVNDNNITLITNLADEIMHTIDHRAETQLVSNSIYKDSLIGNTLSMVNLDVVKFMHEFISSNTENYKLDNSAIGSNYSTLSYVEMEV